MSADRPVVVVEVRGPQQSGVTTLAELIALDLGADRNELDVHYEDSWSRRMRSELVRDLRAVGPRVEVREAEPDDRDRELASLRLEVERLKARRDSALVGGRRMALDPSRADDLEAICRFHDLEVTVGSTTGRFVSESRYERLLDAFHDATRRHLGVTPDSGVEFYDPARARAAEDRRPRHGGGMFTRELDRSTREVLGRPLFDTLAGLATDLCVVVEKLEASGHDARRVREVAKRLAELAAGDLP